MLPTSSSSPGETSMMATVLDYSTMLGFEEPLTSEFITNPESAQYVPFWTEQRPKRRQNRTCDSCRASKRACDVGITSGNAYDDELKYERILTIAHRTKHVFHATRPCTNCAKRRKRCTVDWMVTRKANSKHEAHVKHRKHSGNGQQQLPQQPPDLNHIPEWTADLAALPSATPWAIDWDQSPLICPSLTNCGSDMSAVPSMSDAISPMEQPSTVVEVEDELTGHDHDVAIVSDMMPSPNDNFDPFGTDITRIVRKGSETRWMSSQSLSEIHQRVAIKKGLLKVYHDSMEGALSCWLTERNCPYVSAKFDGREVWSSDWTNRIISRVCSLERATAAMDCCRGRNEAEASKALNLVITAFAAQWAQSDRVNEIQANASRSARETWGQRDETTFDRRLQRSLWHQAFRTLTKASSNLSFKVIFAMIIFSLTQKPHESGSDVPTASSMQDVLNSDSTPMFLEIALRHLHTFRRNVLLGTRNGGASGLNGDARDTFSLLFWLAVMFDTLSAAMYQRPFVVKDDDSAIESTADSRRLQLARCDLDGWNGPKVESSETALELWGSYFLQARSRNGDSRKSRLRWPCSYEDAAAALCDAAPVKVLIFRRVGQLRDLTCGPNIPTSDAVEKAIDAALDVYDHWNQSYGLFIADCIQNHEDLPPRVQSWYILLSGHWHLAVFSLADVIDDIDSAKLGGVSHTRLRQMSGFTTKLRSQSAFLVSELGRCSCMTDTPSSFSQSKDFHFAVNQVALLTEPWTAVLVQSFGRAGEILAQHLSLADANDAKRQLQYCISALTILGRKSDMALHARQLLSNAFRAS